MKSFCRLKFGEKFEVNEVVYQKETALTAVRALGTRADWPGDAPLYLRFWPWSKVETCEFPVSRFTRLMRRDSKRNAAAIARVLASRSPFLDLMKSGTFPKGNRIMATYHEGVKPYDERKLRNLRIEHGSYQPHQDDNRTGPSA